MDLGQLQALADGMDDLAGNAARLADEFEDAALNLTAATVGHEDADAVKEIYGYLMGEHGKEGLELVKASADAAKRKLNDMINGILAALNG